ncbi:Glycosyl transferase family 11 [Pseudovibrio axinellae]|uniref:Glycosyl transferase family 11 n=1 Tax=Pseudovibrio axinellae TaxID=989403 RepID=A0A165YET4_9HYPH|nr:alpha-1,2-fucosyltransferase [Pseudovibrio axinellae]KZL18780.1 Glycosyl transferase family 11 [Pseudovibrio axinellae]SEP93059.1 Glycosyl transferase family 11 [Pseudovibrio axinellae]
MSVASQVRKSGVVRRRKLKPTLIVRIRGGIGNQLFQYALGRKITLETGMKLRFDRSEYDKYFNRSYCLNLLKTQGLSATESEILSVLWPAQSFGQTVRICRKFYPFYQRRYRREDELLQNREVPVLKQSAYLDGYWQKWEIPFSIEELLRKEIVLKKPMVMDRLKLLQRIKSGPSAALHVRYGDYSQAHNLQNFGLCSPGYYKGAMDFLSERIPGLTFYVFSDSPERAREVIPQQDNVYFADSIQDGNDFEDLMVMSSCDHIVTANSTFSWWAAFLNENEAKHVIAPLKWYKNPRLDDSLIVPSHWQRL